MIPTSKEIVKGFFQLVGYALIAVLCLVGGCALIIWSEERREAECGEIWKAAYAAPIEGSAEGQFCSVVRENEQCFHLNDLESCDSYERSGGGL